MDKEAPKNTSRGRFNWSSLITACILTGFIGFGLGNSTAQISDFFESKLSQNQQLPENLDYLGVEELYDKLRIKYAGSLSEDALLDGLKAGLASATGDPFTEYFSPEEAEVFQQELEGKFSGIGAEIGIRNNKLVVIAPIDGTPAMKAGLRTGDAIAAINDEPTDSMSLEEAVKKIRGEAGTAVTLIIVREGRREPLEVKITRQNITVASVRGEVIEGDIAHVELLRFGEDTAVLLHQTLQELKAQGAKSVILDLRNNPGGHLEAAVDVAGEFLKAGEVVVEERKGEHVLDTKYAKAGGEAVGLPVTVLINGGSASASEIVAGALKDNIEAKLIGVKTFGKGSVQELVPLSNGGFLKVTIAQWYTPGGRNISKEGIEPDIEIKLTEKDLGNNVDPQLKKAIEVVKSR